MAMTSIGIEIATRAANRLLWLLKCCLAIPTIQNIRENVPLKNKNTLHYSKSAEATNDSSLLLKNL